MLIVLPGLVIFLAIYYSLFWLFDASPTTILNLNLLLLSLLLKPVNQMEILLF